MTASILLASAAAPGGTASFIVQTVPLLLIFVIFYLLMIRPQQKQMRLHREKIAAVKKGDKVVTGGGLIGRVTKVGDSDVEIDLGGGTKVTALKMTLSDVVLPTSAAND